MKSNRKKIHNIKLQKKSNLKLNYKILKKHNKRTNRMTEN